VIRKPSVKGGPVPVNAVQVYFRDTFTAGGKPRRRIRPLKQKVTCIHANTGGFVQVGQQRIKQAGASVFGKEAAAREFGGPSIDKGRQFPGGFGGARVYNEMTRQGREAFHKFPVAGKQRVRQMGGKGKAFPAAQYFLPFIVKHLFDFPVIDKKQ
jgi:hypothetical protein